MFEAEKSRDALHIAAMQLFELSVAAIPAIDAGLAIAHAMNVEIERHEIGASFDRSCLAAKISAPIRAPIPRRKIQKLFQFVAFHGRRARIKIKRRAPPPHG